MMEDNSEDDNEDDNGDDNGDEHDNDNQDDGDSTLEGRLAHCHHERQCGNRVGLFMLYNITLQVDLYQS